MSKTNSFEKDGEKYTELISQEQLNRRVKELAREISDDYKDKCPILIGVLNGAFIFLSDLIREIDIDCEVDFVKISSYGGGRVSTGQIKTKKMFDSDVNGRHILIVEDIAEFFGGFNWIYIFALGTTVLVFLFIYGGTQLRKKRKRTWR